MMKDNYKKSMRALQLAVGLGMTFGLKVSMIN
jgi:hypothetical protein